MTRKVTETQTSNGRGTKKDVFILPPTRDTMCLQAPLPATKAVKTNDGKNTPQTHKKRKSIQNQKTKMMM